MPSKGSQGLPLSFWLTPLALFLLALSAGIYLKARALDWALAIGSVLPLALILLIFVDVTRDPTSHNLLPFEIIFVLLCSYPPSFAGAYLAKGVTWLLARRVSSGSS